MSNIGRNAARALVFQSAGCVAQGAGCIHHVIDHHAVLAFNLTDDVHDFRLVGLVTTFVDDDEIGIAEALRQSPSANYATHIRRYHDHIFVFLLPDIAEQQW